MTTTKYNIIIVDDHQLILDGLAKYLSEVKSINIVASLTSATEISDYLTRYKIDLIITDLEMPEISGVELLKLVKRDYSLTKVIILSIYNEISLVKELMQLQTDGYLLKTTSQQELVYAVELVLSGKKYFSPEITTKLAGNEIEQNADNKVIAELTKREKEILSLIAQGFSNKQIAEKLFVSPNTIDTHRTNLMNKLDIHNVAGLTRFTIQNNLI